MSGMGRREFVALVGAAAAAWPVAARAQQQSERMRRVGTIDDAPMWNAFRQGLREHGYLEGQNIAFDYKLADGVPERLAEAAAEFIRRPVDVIATYGTPPTRAAKEEVREAIPSCGLNPPCASNSVRILQYAAGCAAASRAIVRSPSRRKWRSKAAMNSSFKIARLREPRGWPAGFRIEKHLGRG